MVETNNEKDLDVIKNEIDENFNEVYELEQEMEKVGKEYQEEIDKSQKEFNEELFKYYGKDSMDINDFISVESKLERLKNRLDYINGDLTFEKEEDIPPYLKEIKNFKINDSEEIEIMIEQIKNSLKAEHLKENIKISKLPLKDNKLKKLNEKLNSKIYNYNKLRNKEELEYSSIDLEEIYENLKYAIDENSFKEKDTLYRFMCALGSYMSLNYEKYPYYIKALSQNIDYIGKFGTNLNQNEEFIKVINNIIKKFEK